jgi:hypothetical protein
LNLSARSAAIDASKSFNDISGGEKKDRDDTSITVGKQNVEIRRRTIAAKDTGVVDDAPLQIEQNNSNAEDSEQLRSSNSKIKAL